MAWKNLTVKKGIVEMLEKNGIKHKLDERNSIIEINRNLGVLGDVNFNVVIAKSYVVLIGFTFEPVSSEHLCNVITILNLINSHLDCGKAYLYLSEDFSVNAKGEMYFGNDSNVDSECLKRMYDRITSMIITMNNYGKAFGLLASGYSAYMAYNAIS